MAVAFVRGANGHLEANWFDGEQWHWIDQGTPPNTTVASVPSATTYQVSADSSGLRVFVFVRGANGHLEVSLWDGTQWQWVDQGTPPNTTVATAPGATTFALNGTQQIFAFVGGADGHLEVNQWDGTQWQWIDQGTPV